MKSPAPAPGKIPGLDGLRGMAILLVLLTHCCQVWIFKGVFDFGWIGVDLFFVLSGFLITGILLDSLNTPHYYGNFIARRVLRIFPVYYANLFFFFVLVPLISKNVIWDLNFFLDHQAYYWTYTQNILYVIKGFPENRIFDHYWSLSVEEQFYIFWPAIIFLFRNKKLIVLCLSLIFLSVVLRNIFPGQPFSYVFTLCRLEGLTIGGVIAYLIRNNRTLLNRLLYPLLLISFLSVIVIFITSGSMHFDELNQIRAGYTVIDIFCGCLLTLALRNDRAGKLFCDFFELRFLKFLGKYSYGIYLYHLPLYVIIYPFIYNGLGILHLTDEITQFFASLLIIGFIIIISVLSFHLFENHFLKLKKYFVH